MLLNEALGQFIEWGSMKYSPNTVRTYTDLIERFIRFAGDKSVEEVTILDVTKYFAHLQKKGYYESSVAFMMIALRQFIKFLFLRRLTNFDYQLISIPKYVSKSYIPVETDEAKAMVAKISADNFSGLRNKTILLFLYASGVRVSELCDLKVSELNLDDKQATIISKKNRKRRLIFWNQEAHDALLPYIAQRKAYATGDFLFISLDRRCLGSRLTTRSVQRLVKSVRIRECISPHSYRHGFGMREVKAKIHPRYVQIHLGHLHLNSSQVYMDVCDSDAIAAYKEVGH